MTALHRSAGWLWGALACACASEPTAPPAAPPHAGVVIAPVKPCPPADPEAGPELPTVELRKQPIKVDDGYTVWGLGYLLRSRQHRSAVTGEPVTVLGYVVATNLSSAPACAVHETGQADPEDCSAPVPAFWLGDRPDAPRAESVKVMGFASNYAQIYDAIRQFDSGHPAHDAFWGQEIPNPLPAAGARVRVRGRFGPTFSLASSGGESDDTMGIVTFISMETLEPASELATLPGVTRSPQP
ncbi:MAG TPA: hypothetical protein VI197_12310 [Polyangiaceae bacterium]